MHGGNKMKQVVNAQNAPAAIGPYSHCVKVGKMVFTSGQIGIDPPSADLLKALRLKRFRLSRTLKPFSKLPVQAWKIS